MKLFQQENCIEVTSKLLSALNVKVTSSTLEKDITFHPDYPSLLSISDTLGKYGVDNISVKIQPSKLHQLPLPCIVQIKSFETNDNLFSIIKSIDSSGLTYYHPLKLHWVKITLKDFAVLWPTRIALFTDTANAHGEKDYLKNKRKEQQLNITKYSTFLATPLLALVLIVMTLFQNGSVAIIPSVYFILTLSGVFIGGALAWYDMDQNNAVLQQMCSAGKKMSCSTVLNSKASKVLGVSWSTIGLMYFLSCLFIQILIGLSNPVTLSLLAWLNMFVVPFVLFSVYYQWRITKQWCTLCLCVQVVLVLQLITAFLNDWHIFITLKTLLLTANLILIACIISFVIVNLLLPALRSTKENKDNQAELQRLKHNPQIFEALLEKQKKITGDPAELGILLGNPQGAYKLIKVCNPYCDPCAKAHLPMDELLQSHPNLQVQIIFSVENIDGDVKATAAKHLLAIAQNNSESTVKKALDEWYLAKTKDYKLFATKFPMNAELKEQDANVKAMSQWCKDNNIMFTPTFFVNGYQLPEMYRVGDLKNLIPPTNTN
ncbi:vitamin K epoxide reductase family protein [Pedobacter gandavensis]|uniref:vitamin K epoxide reductase family protein n=1 Tax=Pedobacter gandavensis TaxID=2679963 RepID=UPI00247A7C7F|nr:vitamin K epoxide reductase family protein [Pedobacter gandavensis]WGQ10177.1 vitamin K epoxide reductase family protein [Pedobacter gandavensis]